MDVEKLKLVHFGVAKFLDLKLSDVRIDIREDVSEVYVIIPSESAENLKTAYVDKDPLLRRELEPFQLSECSEQEFSAETFA